jgi:hypothetical protein
MRYHNFHAARAPGLAHFSTRIDAPFYRAGGVFGSEEASTGGGDAMTVFPAYAGGGFARSVAVRRKSGADAEDRRGGDNLLFDGTFLQL